MPYVEFQFVDAKPLSGSHYLWPAVRSFVSSHSFPSRRAFDLGCGNGATTNMLSELGFETIGVDPSKSGIAIAKEAYPHCTFANASGYDDLAKQFGQFGLVVSLEVLQCCNYPTRVAQTLFDLVEGGGTVLVATTYHGYLKYLALALTGKLDHHLNALWDAGPCKYFSMKTLETLLKQAGFRQVEFRLVGRIPVFAKAMIAIARKDV
jgi:2-polyprenyl-3-methyl-5-hydroxy-6-metoxy-1,4-benzoquinol methylase